MADTMKQQQSSHTHLEATPQTEQQPTQQKTWQTWLGFSDKTAWDWLQLMSSLAVPIIVLIATLMFTVHQDKANQAQHDSDQKIALDQQEEDTLKTYLDDMTTLLLDKKLGSQNQADMSASTEAAVVAQAKTLIVLRRLTDPQRKAIVIQFLYEANLINDVPPVISLIGANLSNVDLSNDNLDGANLNDVNLSSAKMHRVHLRYASLSGANLHGVDLSGTDLTGVDFSGADLTGADLSGADLTGANLNKAIVTKEQLAQATSLNGITPP